jgi:hypothetical protein
MKIPARLDPAVHGSTIHGTMMGGMMDAGAQSDHSHRPQRALAGSFPPCFHLNFAICLNILGRLGRVLQYSGAAVHGRVVAIVSHGVARLVYYSLWSCARGKDRCTAEGDEIGPGGC